MITTSLLPCSGHFSIKKKMRESNAILGGELVSHILTKDSWFQFDGAFIFLANYLRWLASPIYRVTRYLVSFLEDFLQLKLRIKFQKSLSFVNDSFARLSQFSSRKAGRSRGRVGRRLAASAQCGYQPCLDTSIWSRHSEKNV